MHSPTSAVLLAGALSVSGAAFAAGTAHWTYSGEEGPGSWVRLAPEFAACDGKNQSPVNLTGFIKADLKPIEISYQAGGDETLNNGHTVQVNYAPWSSISIDGIQFDLKQFHFHGGCAVAGHERACHGFKRASGGVLARNAPSE
jgi:carbonic anhydrase